MASGLAACGLLSEPTPDIAAKNVYDANGLAFDYPGNWKSEAEVSASDGIETVLVSVESSGSALVMVQQFKPAIAIDPDEMLGLMSAEIRKAAGDQLAGALSVAEGSSSQSTRTMLGAQRPVRRSNFVVSLLGERVPHTFEITVAELSDRSIAVFTQSADEDLAKVTPAFELIVGSLVAR